MIICYQGTPGSGKTYDAIVKIIANLKKGRKVYTNIDGLGDAVRRENIKQIAGLNDLDMEMNLIYVDRLDFKEVIKMHKTADKGSLLVIDEIHNYFNAREWQSEANKDFCSWASTHRHYGYDLVMITQDIEKVDKQVRSLVEYTYQYRKINFMGKFINKKYIVYAYCGEPVGKHLNKSIYTYDDKIFHCYDSYVTKDTKEVGIMKHVNIFKHPIFYAIPVMLIFFIIMFSRSSFIHGSIIPGSSSLKKNEIKKESVKKEENKKGATIIEYKVLMNGKKTENVINIRDGKFMEREETEEIKNKFNYVTRSRQEIIKNEKDTKIEKEIKYKKVGNIKIYDGEGNVIEDKEIKEIQDDKKEKAGSAGHGGPAFRPHKVIDLGMLKSNNTP